MNSINSDLHGRKAVVLFFAFLMGLTAVGTAILPAIIPA
jgi:hypothetical protein